MTPTRARLREVAAAWAELGRAVATMDPWNWLVLALAPALGIVAGFAMALWWLR